MSISSGLSIGAPTGLPSKTSLGLAIGLSISTDILPRMTIDFGLPVRVYKRGLTIRTSIGVFLCRRPQFRRVASMGLDGRIPIWVY